jgi:hypothetical protein
MSVTEKATQFDNMNAMMKMRAIGALSRQDDKYESERPIREDAEKHGDRVLEITQFANYHFVKTKSRGRGSDGKESYQVYIDGKRCFKITSDPKMIMLIALADEFDGPNSQIAQLTARMLKMNNDWTKGE